MILAMAPGVCLSVLLVVILVAVVLMTAFAKYIAVPCPKCGSKMYTHLEGEWDGEEDWNCHRCNIRYSVKDGKRIPPTVGGI